MFPPFHVGDREIYEVGGEDRTAHFMMLNTGDNPPGTEQTAIVLDDNNERVVVRLGDLGPAP